MKDLDSAEIDNGADAAEGPPTRTLEKGLQLLSFFDAEHREWTLKDLRDKAGLPKATARRLVKTLEHARWVAQDPVTGKYRLGPSALRAYYLATSDTELVRVAHPFLVELEEETTETAIISVWSYDGPVILDTVPTSRPFKPYTAVGMPLPGISSADAAALIAFMPEETWDALLATPVEPRTPKTVTDPEKIKAHWRRTRELGIAYDWEEWNEGAPAVAAPVFDQGGELRAALTVVAPIERCSPDEMERYAAAVKKTAADLSKALGHRG
jgi:IclR family transcriptional regulator, KDG regulon repressor